MSEILANNASKFQNGTKKPKGKGYSKGTYGEKTFRVSPKKASTEEFCPSEDDDVPDFEDIPDLIPPPGFRLSDFESQTPKTRRKKGYGAISYKSKSAQKSANTR